MKDTFGDKIDIDADAGMTSVYLTVHDRVTSSKSLADLSPKKARKLAKKLRKAADAVDGAGLLRDGNRVRVTAEMTVEGHGEVSELELIRRISERGYINLNDDDLLSITVERVD